MIPTDIRSKEQQQRVLDFCERHAQDPQDVYKFVVDHKRQVVHFSIYKRNNLGSKFNNPATGEPATREVTVPLVGPAED